MKTRTLILYHFLFDLVIVIGLAFIVIQSIGELGNLFVNNSWILELGLATFFAHVFFCFIYAIVCFFKKEAKRGWVFLIYSIFSIKIAFMVFLIISTLFSILFLGELFRGITEILKLLFGIS